MSDQTNPGDGIGSRGNSNPGEGAGYDPNATSAGSEFDRNHGDGHGVTRSADAGDGLSAPIDSDGDSADAGDNSEPETGGGFAGGNDEPIW